ncbi:LysR family transcriptional regulator [Acinetobacter schindleri]|uniref:LysR family transcriptional regulator n=1 Tax=Acinetobacter schindleri TaxID=108981 RepID=UPI002DBC8C76|nr:LysR family transcriptional regulator [Acinetobacter schindleri]MEB5929196.1 LysR substrate-binding domain-containing protein [Acinetobacter schindleri]
MDRLLAMELFTKIHELGTLREASEDLKISTAAATRLLASLESHLNVKLIERSTRRNALTSAGYEYYQQCKTFINELNEAEAKISASSVEPEGTINLTSSISFAKLYLAPLIPEFHKRYPKIKINIVGDNRYYDILNSNVDIAIRTREFEPDSNITIRKLATTKRILAASPAYLAKKGTPAKVEDLSHHDILIYSHANNPNELNFKKQNEKDISFKCNPLMETNDGQIVRAAALAGAGILIQPMYIIYKDIVSGRLVPILSDWDLPLLTINIAFQTRRYMPAKTRLFIDFLIENFQKEEYERYWNMRLI